MVYYKKSNSIRSDTMAIKSVQLKNFLIFKDEFSIDFEDGINVIIWKMTLFMLLNLTERR